MTAATIAVGQRRSRARTGVRRERHEPAYALLLAVMALTAIGVVMVFSASSVRSYISRADPAAQGLEQLVWAGIGLVGLFVAMRIDFRHLRYLAIPIYVITLVLLVVVLVPGIGAEINGSRRWIVIPGHRHAPAGRVREARRRPLPGPLARPTREGRRVVLERARPVRAARRSGLLPDRRRAGPRDRRRVRGRRGQHLLHGRRQRALPGRDLQRGGRRGLADDQPRRATRPSGSRPSSIPFRDPLGSWLQHDPGAAGAGPGRDHRPRPRREPPEVPLPAGAVDGLHLRDHRRGVGPRRHADGGRAVRRDRLPGLPDRGPRPGHVLRPAWPAGSRPGWWCRPA